MTTERQRLYWVWADMRSRCNCKTHKAYHNYGGRGIAVCDEWDSFDRFAEDMGDKPTPSHTLDRIENDMGYSPDNCRWATRQEQALNKREYKNSSSGHRNISFERRTIRGYTYERWRVRVRREGKILSHKRFHNLSDAIKHRDMLEETYERSTG